MDNITLIGMPGSGKSTLGSLLADRLRYEFIDVDGIIESLGQPLQQIIDEKGEDEFLRIEEACLLSLRGPRKVFSPGGSCVLLPNAMLYLRRISLIVFIDVPVPLLKERLSSGTIDMRGIVGLRKQTIDEVFDFRQPLYSKYAHLVIHVDQGTIDNSLEILINRIINRGRRKPRSLRHPAPPCISAGGPRSYNGV